MSKSISLFVTVIFIVATSSLQAQEKIRKAYRPDIPGSFMIDLGFNNGLNKPADFKQGFWGSRTLNLYYHYPVRIGTTKFTYNPGGGFSFERFKLTNNYTLLNPQAGGDGANLLDDPTKTFLIGAGIKRSMLISNYFDLMPLEFRFDSNPKDLTRSFNVSLGARVGVLMESHTKIEYTLNGESITAKDKQKHGLNPFRYGVYTRIGIGNFNWFAFYNFSPYFATGKGPHNSTTDLTTTTMTTFTIGISLNGF